MKKLSTIHKNLDIFFCFLNNKVYFKKAPILVINKSLVRNVLLYISVKKNLNIKLQLWVKHRNLYFIKFLYTLYNSIHYSVNNIQLNNGFFIKLDLIGLGFRITKISEKIVFFSLGWANGVYFLVPEAVRIFILSKKRQIIIFGFDINKVYNIASMLILLRKTRPYRITGFVNPIFIQRLRSGKQR